MNSTSQKILENLLEHLDEGQEGFVKLDLKEKEKKYLARLKRQGYLEIGDKDYNLIKITGKGIEKIESINISEWGLLTKFSNLKKSIITVITTLLVLISALQAGNIRDFHSNLFVMLFGDEIAWQMLTFIDKMGVEEMTYEQVMDFDPEVEEDRFKEAFALNLPPAHDVGGREDYYNDGRDDRAHEEPDVWSVDSVDRAMDEIGEKPMNEKEREKMQEKLLPVIKNFFPGTVEVNIITKLRDSSYIVFVGQENDQVNLIQMKKEDQWWQVLNEQLVKIKKE